MNDGPGGATTRSLSLGSSLSPHPAQLAALHEAQARLESRRTADRAERLRQLEDEQAFRAALRFNTQPALLEPSATPTVRPQTPPQPLVRVQVARPRTEAPSRAAQAAKDEAERQGHVERVMAAAEETITSAVRPRARARARAVYRALVEATFELIQQRNQLAHLTSYTYFTVLDVLPVATNLGTATCERAIDDLRSCGLISTRRVYQPAEFLDQTTGEVITRSTCIGVWLTVLLKAVAPGLRARVMQEELPIESPRDLAADRKRGHTGYALKIQHQEEQALKAEEALSPEVRESVSPQGGNFKSNPLLQWSLPKTNVESLVTSDSLTSATQPAEVVWALGAILSEHPQRRRDLIEQAGQRLSILFRDRHSAKAYYRLLWCAVNAEFRGIPAFFSLQNAMQRVLIAMQEVPVRSPGALLLHELGDQGCGWLAASGWHDRARHVA